MTVSDLRETLLFLLLAGLAVPLLQRLRINQMPGFLLVGLCFGPHGLGTWAGSAPWLADITFHDVEGVKMFGELGILFLMFMIGLELSPAKIWALRRDVFGSGVLQVALTAGAIGAIAMWFGNPPSAALTLGLTLAMSSTAVVMQLLGRAGALAAPLGQACFGILMLQDLAVVPVLILVEGLAVSNGALWSSLLLAVAKAAATIALVYVAGRRLARPLFAAFAVQRQPEVFVALILLLTLGVAAATAAAGLSMALGALLAGLLLADTEFQYEVEIIVEPFRGLLMGMFFMAVGMELDLRIVAQYPVLLPLSVVGLFAVKGGVITALLGRLGWRQALHAGLLMGQGGEFAFIILGYAVSAGLLAGTTGQFMLVLVTASMLATPAAAALGARVAARASAGKGEPGAGPADQAHRAGHIIIGGYGRVGRLVADVLERQGIAHVAVERDHQLAAAGRDGTSNVYSGDASMPDMMARLGVGRSAAVVLTMDDPKAALQATHALRRQYPAIPIFARARDEKHARLLKEAGADGVISETVESGLQLAHFALGAAGMPEAAAGFHIGVERAERVARLIESNDGDKPARPPGK